MGTDGAVGVLLRAVLDVPNRLRAAATFDLPSPDPATEAIVVGRGLSGVAAYLGSLVAAAAPGSVIAYEEHGLPPWVEQRRPLLVALIAPGDGEETVATVRDASRLRLPAVVVTSGEEGATIAAETGYPVVRLPAAPRPDARLGFEVGAVVGILHRAGLADDPVPALREAASEVEALGGDGAGPGVTLGRDLAEALSGHVAVISGEGDVARLAATQWTTLMRRTAAAQAYAGEVSELAHHRHHPWEGRPERGGGTARLVVLRDASVHPAAPASLDLSGVMAEGKLGMAGEVWALGNGVLSRFFTLAFVGAVTAVAMAELAGVEAGAVPAEDPIR